MHIYTVYKITNNINDKIYIGFTKNGIKHRMRGHKQSMKRSSNKLASAMRDIGFENFHIEEIYQSSCPNDALAKEAILIEEHNCIENGYNTSKGGYKIRGKQRILKNPKDTQVVKSKEVLLKEQYQDLQEQFGKMIWDRIVKDVQSGKIEWFSQ